MPEPRDHLKDRPVIETIARQVPGFRGYFEKEDRRQADALQREWLADRLERSKRSIDALTRPMADAGQIDLLPEVDRLRGRIDKLIGRIRGAMQGYSGFFDLVQVDEALLDRVYELDVDLIAQVDTLAGAVDELPKNPEQIAAALTDLNAQAEQLERLWDLRADMLAGLE